MSKYVFTCYKCGTESGFSRKKPGEIILEFKPSNAENEKRTYECECCGADNEIENTVKDWMDIDKG